ncbi:methylated-DNA--[protein]-cysteine S-methyltransferase [Bacillus sp. DNRA2]|uniref:methylated-DNA--[protein]-cysteine S-methyltransferase n=1 Tax=Bacillus sp. DNRA2 TaxID=2723053 RepID=UPI00145C45C5|nr:methylated-DNA--[protein]-cysteine S-methyltransferase [Bacillus sp. DNRA2]NMD71407.1 methylated-DNA--[protein]-cysteine S-methyltransferase [Bacillus sp. DNRA2]
MRYYSKVNSLIDELYLVAESDQLAVIHLGEADFNRNEDINTIIYQPEHPILQETAKQLQEYFSGKRKTFDLELGILGTDFQKAVWEQLSLIPYGETRSYQDIANAVENPKAVRAIGQANKANRFPIIIPCHRVIGKNRTLTGYAGTRVDIKEKLLEFEGAL